MDLKEQRYVCALADYGSLTRASEKLFISQPALSLYINNLEKNMGVKLFERSGKKFVLTWIGEQYVKTAREMLRLEGEFNRTLSDAQQGKTGRLRIGVSLRRGVTLFPPVIAKYEKMWPGNEVRIFEGNNMDLREMLKNGELDMLVTNESEVPNDMQTTLLFEEEFLLVVPVSHPLNEKAEIRPDARYKVIRPELLNGEKLILHSAWLSSRKIEDQVLNEYKISPSAIRVISSTQTAVQMAAEGLGIGFIREGFIKSVYYSKPVNYYMLDIDEHTRRVVASYRKGPRIPEYMESMIRLLKEQGEEMVNFDNFPEPVETSKTGLNRPGGGITDEGDKNVIDAWRNNAGSYVPPRGSARGPRFMEQYVS